MSTSFKPAARYVVPFMLLGLCGTCCSAIASSDKCAALLAIIQSPDSSENEKATAFEDLAAVGDTSSIEPLSKLLSHPKMSHYARYALQNNPDPAAGDALRRALDEVDGEAKVGVINSLASRGDQQAVGKLSELLSSDNSDCAVAAAGALATIGTEPAVSALESCPAAKSLLFADALLEAALVRHQAGESAKAAALLQRIVEADPPNHVKQAATIALVNVIDRGKANSLIAELLASDEEWRFEAGLQAVVTAGPSVYAQSLANALSASSPDRQLRLLSALETKTKDVSLDVVRTACENQDAGVRIAACSALGTLGNSSDAPLLVRMVLEDADAADAATEALVKMQDPKLNEFLLSLLSSPQHPEKALGAKLIGLRYVQNASPELFDMARSSDAEAVRMAALGALRRIAPATSLDQVLDLVKLAQSTDEEQLARAAATEVAGRAPDPQPVVAIVAQRLQDWPPAKQGILLDVLAKIGDSESLKLVAKAAQSDDRAIQDQATRVLGSWSTADAAPVLLGLAKSDHAFGVRALRGYLRIARQFNVGEEERLAMCREALAVAKRDQERLLALQIAARSPSIESLELAVSQLSTDALGPKASESVVLIAEKIAPNAPEAASKAAQAVIDAGGNDQVLARARKLLVP